ncbi:MULTISPECIES: hypothetical protein [unclassified Thioalkalivibrio]|nr:MULTISPECIES: hypothetical protein [unclassified Thioalkalivibrio]
MTSMNVPVEEFTTPDPVTANEDMAIDELREEEDTHDLLDGLRRSGSVFG